MPKEEIAAIENDDGTWARSYKEKATLLAVYLEDTFQYFPRQIAKENVIPVN